MVNCTSWTKVCRNPCLRLSVCLFNLNWLTRGSWQYLHTALSVMWRWVFVFSWSSARAVQLTMTKKRSRRWPRAGRSWVWPLLPQLWSRRASRKWWWNMLPRQPDSIKVCVCVCVCYIPHPNDTHINICEVYIRHMLWSSLYLLDSSFHLFQLIFHNSLRRPLRRRRPNPSQSPRESSWASSVCR